MYGNPELGDHPGQQPAAGLVDLSGHQARHHLNDVCFQPKLAQSVGGFQSQQAAADHHTGGIVTVVTGELGGGADRVEVVQRAVDVAGGQVVSGHRGGTKA